MITVITVITARCYACQEDQPVGEFAPDASKASGRQSICRACDRAKSARYYAENRERKRAAYQRVPRREAVCAGCGANYLARGGQRYCGPACRPPTGATVTVRCDRCGREFEARARDRERGQGRFCSKRCAALARGLGRTKVAA